MPNIADHYKSLHRACGNALEQSLAEPNLGGIAESHAFIEDLDNWIKAIEGRLESSLLKTACLEYQSALIALLQGNYRSAFTTRKIAISARLDGLSTPTTGANRLGHRRQST
jgi:hypothetical protein